MYGNLGNKHNQDVIRDLNPQPKEAKSLIHCRLLVKNPSACNDVNGKGKICPKNPHHPVNVAKREEIMKQYDFGVSEKAAEVFEQTGRGIDSLLELGLVRELTDLTPSELLLGLHFQRVRKQKERHEQAIFIISELAKAMNAGKK